MNRGRWFQRESVYVCGRYLDGAIYPVFQKPGKRRKKSKPTSEIQQRLNQRNAEKKLTRLVHNNFTEQDLALHLTYRQEPETEEAVRRTLTNFLRRVKRRMHHAGMELKYISCTEYGKTTGRVHHHVILNGGLDRDTLEKLWGNGYANSKRLQFGEDGVTGLAHYMAKDKHFYKRWNQSRNLMLPEEIQRDGALTAREVSEAAQAIEQGRQWDWFERRYPEYRLVEAVCYRNQVNGGTYLQFLMRKKEQAGEEREKMCFGRSGESRKATTNRGISTLYPGDTGN